MIDRKFNRFKESGFTLVEILIALGVMGISMVAVGVVYSLINKSKINISEKVAATEFTSSLSKHLSSRLGCMASMVGQAMPGAVATPMTINNYTGYGAPGSGVISSGTKLSNNLQLTSMTIKDKGVPPTDTLINTVTYRRIIAQIKLVLNVKVENNNFPIEKYIEFPVLTKVSPASGTVDVCGLDASTSEICTAIGGTFSPPNICTPSSVCRFMGMAYGCWKYTSCPGVSYPSAQRFTLTSQAASTTPPPSVCSKGGVPTSTGQNNYTYVGPPCGKSGCTTYSNIAYFYICLQCT